MSEWKRLTILWPADGSFPPHRPRDGHQAHALTALIGSTFVQDPRCSIPEGMFHHQDGKAGSGLSPIRYSANRRGMSITAVGEEAVDVLAESGHRLTRALGRQAGQPLQEQWTSGQVRWSPSATVQTYQAHHFVYSRKPAHQFGDMEADMLANTVTPAITDLLEVRILKGLQRQASLLGLDELQFDPLIRVASVGHLSGWKRGAGFYGLVAHDVVFESDLHLLGPWHIGSLCLLGCGSINKL